MSIDRRRRGLGLVHLLVLGVFVGRAPAQDAVRLSVSTPRTVYSVHETVPIVLELRVERSFLEGHMVQLFPKELDLPVQIDAEWLGGIDDVLQRRDAPGDSLGSSFVLGQELRHAATTVAEDALLLRLELRYEALRAGPLVLAAPVARYARTTRFEEDFFGERVAVDRHDERVAASELRLQVGELPEEGRPASFTGAVGNFSLRVECEPGPLRIGDVFAFHLIIEGEGNWEAFEAPSLAALPGLHVLGRLDARENGGRRLSVDFVVREKVDAVPPLEFAYYEPGESGGYRVLRTPAVPLDIDAPEPPAPTPIAAEAPAAAASSTLDRWIAGGVGMILGAGLMLLVQTLRARRARPAAATADAAQQAAHEQILARVDAEEADAARVLEEAVALRLGVRGASVLGPELDQRLAAAGVAPELRARVGPLLEALVAARYGGPAPALTPPELRDLIRELAP